LSLPNEPSDRPGGPCLQEFIREEKSLPNARCRLQCFLVPVFLVFFLASSALAGSDAIDSASDVGLVLIPAAAFVGYGRVEADEHWTKDVLGGAAIGIASGWIFTSRFRKEPGQAFFFPAIGRKSAALALGLSF